LPTDKTRLNVDFVYQQFDGKIDRGQAFPADGSLYDTPISLSMSAANDFLKENTLNTTIGLTHKFNEWLSFNAIYLNSSYAEDMQEHTQANAYYKQIGNGADAFRYADSNKVLMTFNQRKRYFANNSFNNYFNFTFQTGFVKHKLLVGYDYFLSEQKVGSSGTAAQVRGYWQARYKLLLPMCLFSICKTLRRAMAIKTSASICTNKMCSILTNNTRTGSMYKSRWTSVS